MTTEPNTSMTGGLSALLAQATPGPWRNQGWDEEERGWFILGGGAEFSDAEHMVGAALPQPTEGRDTPSCAADARLIALAPDAVKWILDTYAKYAHQFDDETLAAFDALNKRAET